MRSGRQWVSAGSRILVPSPTRGRWPWKRQLALPAPCAAFLGKEAWTRRLRATSQHQHPAVHRLGSPTPQHPGPSHTRCFQARLEQSCPNCQPADRWSPDAKGQSQTRRDSAHYWSIQWVLVPDREGRGQNRGWVPPGMHTEAHMYR